MVFDKLNADGQLEAIKRTEELTQVSVYQAAQPGFSSDEIEKWHHFIQMIQNQQLELSMIPFLIIKIAYLCRKEKGTSCEFFDRYPQPGP